MPRFCVLASGSSGNAAFLQTEGFGLLIDIGIGPRLLSSRLACIGASWKDVNAVVLTHVHTDHWKDRSLAQLCTHRIPLYCHPEHVEVLSHYGPAFEPLQRAGLVRHFEDDQTLELPNSLRCLPIRVPHDSEPTFAFRIDGSSGLFGGDWSIGYAADLGTTPIRLLDAFRDVNVLALEFNHDEEMQHRSGRSKHLIDRVLGDRGHLSNRQAADSLGSHLRSSRPGSLRHLIQLHLSRQCNSPALALAAAKKVLEGIAPSIVIQTAAWDRPTNAIELAMELV